MDRAQSLLNRTGTGATTDADGADGAKSKRKEICLMCHRISLSGSGRPSIRPSVRKMFFLNQLEKLIFYEIVINSRQSANGADGAKSKRRKICFRCVIASLLVSPSICMSCSSVRPSVRKTLFLNQYWKNNILQHY